MGTVDHQSKPKPSTVNNMSDVYYKCVELPFLTARKISWCWPDNDPPTLEILAHLVFSDIDVLRQFGLFDITSLPTVRAVSTMSFKLPSGAAVSTEDLMILAYHCGSKDCPLEVSLNIEATTRTLKRAASSSSSSSSSCVSSRQSKRRVISGIYFSPRESPEYTRHNHITLGHYVQSRPHGAMDEGYIDLSSWQPRLQTLATAQAIAKAWEWCTQENSGWLANSVIISQLKMRYSAQNYVNVIGSRCQTGKTKYTILAMYFTALAFGIVPVGLVRNISGSDHKTRYSAELDDLSNHVVTYLRENCRLSTLLLSMFRMESFDRNTFKRVDRERTEFGKWTSPFVIVDRHNPTTLKQLVGLLFNNTVTEFNSVLREDGQRVFKYGLFCDEDDECAGSANRERLAVEIQGYQIKQTAFQVDEGEGREEDGDDEGERGNPSVVDLEPVLREKCAIMTCTSATWFNIIFMTKGSTIPNPIQIKPPANYKGYFLTPSPNENNNHSVGFHTTEEHVTGKDLSGLERDPGIQTALRHADMCRQVDRYPHISLLINTRAVRLTVAGKALAAELCVLAGTQNISFGYYSLPTISFNVPVAFNTSEEIFNMSNDLVAYMLTHHGTNIEIDMSCPAREGVHSLDVKFVPTSARTLGRCYDFCEAFFAFLPAASQPFIICTAGAHAARSMTFKTSNHKLPLTHMYMSGHSDSISNFGDTIQTSGRICSVDDLDVQRHMFCPLTVQEDITVGYQVYEDLLRLFSDFPDMSWEQASKHLDVRHRTFYEKIIRLGENISKRAYCLSIYSSLIREAVYNGPDEWAEEAEADVTRSRGGGSTVDCLQAFFLRHGEHSEFNEHEIATLLLQEGLCVVYEQEAARPLPPTPQHFVYQRRRQHTGGGHDKDAIVDRLRRTLIQNKRTLYKEIPFTGEIIGARLRRKWQLRPCSSEVPPL